MSCVALLALTEAVGCGGTVSTERAIGGGATGSGSKTGATVTGSGGDAHGSGGQTGAGSGGRATPGSGGDFGTGGAALLGGVTPRERDAGTCAAITFIGDPVSLDVLVLLDRSESMSCASAGGDRWTAVEKGIASYLMQASGRQIGIRYFDSEESGDAGPSCNPGDYQKPDVEIADLPGNAQGITDSFRLRSPGGRRPTAAALAGALRHASEWRDAHAGRRIAVVLVTNGEPDACGTAADVASAAVAGAKDGIDTFVIGLMDSRSTCLLDSNPIQTPGLDAIALAGDTRKASIVNLLTGGEGMIAALNGVRLKTPLTCRYTIPAGLGGMTLDPKRISVAYTPSGSPDDVPVAAVSDEAACDATGGGWYFVEPNHPSEIEICPKSCDAIDAQLGRVEIYFNCGPGPPPP